MYHTINCDHSHANRIANTNLKDERENLKRAGQLEQRHQKRPEKLPPPVVSDIVGNDVRIVIFVAATATDIVAAAAVALLFRTSRMLLVVAAETNHRHIAVGWLPIGSTLVECRTHLLQRGGVDVLRIVGARNGGNDVLDDIRRLGWR